MIRDEIIELVQGYNTWAGLTAPELADKILAIIDGERCEWVKHKDSAYLYKSTCPEWDGTYRHISTFCPFCGKRIEVRPINLGMFFPIPRKGKKVKMIREIKFRAWDTLYSELIYDVQFRRDDRTFDNFLDSRYALMQFTGLKDKNGKEIYEGDCYLWKKEKGVVVWDKGSFWCKPESPYDAIWDRLHLFADELEVVGNIYENPELLQKEKP